MPLIIGITGTVGSGKDTIAEYFLKKGYVYHSLSDVIREECRRKSLEITRENLITTGNDLREKFGYNYLAKIVRERIRNNHDEKAVVVSIRHPLEVEELRKEPGFKMILVDALLELRYQRTQQRNQRRPEDESTFEQFKLNEERERTGTAAGQQLDSVAKLADFTILNGGTLEELTAKLDKIDNRG